MGVDLQIDGVARVECYRRSTFVVGSLVTAFDAQSFDSDQQLEFLHALLGVSGNVWWWCDSTMRDGLKWLLDAALDAGAKFNELIVKGRTDRILSMRFDRSLHRDAASLWPEEIAEVCRSTRYPIEPLIGTWACPCASPTDCGGRCSIRPDLSEAATARLRGASIAWGQSTWKALHSLKDWQMANDVDGRGTPASSAWNTVRRRYHLPSADKSRSSHVYTRGAYYPGRTEAVKTEAKEAHEYDFNFAHPSVYGSVPMPTGEPAFLYERASRFYASGLPGVVTATITIPESHLPPIPWRSPTGRVGYPTGTVTGTWSAKELRYAESHGTVIEKIYHGLIWFGQTVLLRDWAAFLFTERARLKSIGDHRESYVKALAVALVGAWGLSPYAEDVIIDPEHIRVCPCIGLGTPQCPCQGLCCSGCEGECGAMTCISEKHAIWTRRRWQILDRSQVIWALDTSGGTRTRTHTEAIQGPDGGDDVLHIATDGFLCERPRHITPGLGGLQHKRNLEEINIKHGNTYTATDRDTGEVIQRAAGEPQSSIVRYRQDGFYVQTPVPFRESLSKSGKSNRSRLQYRRRNSIVDPDRSWLGNRLMIGNGTITRAPTRDELENVK